MNRDTGDGAPQWRPQGEIDTERNDASGLDRSVELLAQYTGWLWLGAFLFYGVGDFTTTLIGLRFPTIAEASPVAAWVIRTVGLWGIIPVKVASLAAFFGLWAAIPRPVNTGVPLGLCATGFLATLWNLTLIVSIAW